MASIHIGKKIQAVFKKSSITMVDFTRKLDLTRQMGYDIFERKNINTDLLLRISKILNHDFFEYYRRQFKIK